MIDEDLKKDIYEYSAGICWFSWAKRVGVSTGSDRIPDLTTWDSCPRNRISSCATYANGRMCAAHHLIAGPRHKISQDSSIQDSSIKFCKCPLNDLIANGCSCGGE